MGGLVDGDVGAFQGLKGEDLGKLFCGLCFSFVSHQGMPERIDFL